VIGAGNGIYFDSEQQYVMEINLRTFSFFFLV
jgi:hypothetical protein